MKEYTFLAEKKYLLLPIKDGGKAQKVFFVCGGHAWDFDVQLTDAPDRFAPFDLSVWQGKECLLRGEIPENAPFRQTDEVSFSAPGEGKRPLLHFSASFGWLNDPNGLYEYQGEFHLFYQHNPFGTGWGNMHWGHAKSSDLLHWEHLPEALFPDAEGTMYSGSAIVDKENRSGLKKGEHPPIFLFYTAAAGHNKISAGKHFTLRQCISLDGGKTFEKTGRSLVPGIVYEDRDPKVVFVPEKDAFVMAYYYAAPQSHEFVLMESKNLLDWQEFQRITLPGDWECPDLFPITLPDGAKKWIFTGACAVYRWGEFREGRLCLSEETHSLTGYAPGREYYAGQVYDYWPEDGSVRQVSWLRLPLAGEDYNMQMAVPAKIRGEYLENQVWLKASPAPEFLQGMEKIACTPKTLPLLLKAHAGKPQAIRLEMAGDFALSVGDAWVRVEKEKIHCPSGVYALPAWQDKIWLVLDQGMAEVFAGDGVYRLAFRYEGKDACRVTAGEIARAELYALRAE